MEKKSKTFLKVHLENSPIILNSGIDETRRIGIQFIWSMSNFSQLKNKVFYMKSIRSVKNFWNFRLLKHKKTLFLILHTNNIPKNVSFRFIGQGGSYLECGETIEIAKGLYVAEHSLNFIDSKEQFFSEDILKIECSYWKSVENTCDSIPYDSHRNTIDTRILCNNIRELYLNTLYSDFTIKVKDVVFNVHRLILTTQSVFFNELFEKEGSNSVKISSTEFNNIHPAIMHEVLLYVYSGELKNMVIIPMVAVTDVANQLKITSLVDRCMNYFNEHLAEENVTEILRIAIRLSVQNLARKAYRFLEEHQEEVFKTPKWKEFKKDVEDAICRSTFDRSVDFRKTALEIVFEEA